MHYNRIVDVVDQRLSAAGAEALREIGRADDVKGETEEHLLSWRESTISLLSKRFNVEVMNRQAEPTFTVVEDTSLDLQDFYLGEPMLQERGTSQLYPSKVTMSYSMTHRYAIAYTWR
jgi:sulfite reductase alpha subunit-like flavoprotein